LKEHFKEGLQTRLLLVNEGARGFRPRGFIEFAPSGHSWRGVKAKNYMIIHCIWVVGKNRGKGYGTKLLIECIKSAESMNGVAAIATDSTWLSKKSFFVRNGFEKADEYPPHLTLYAKRFSRNTPLPKFNRTPESRLKQFSKGITIFKSDQCPYMQTYSEAIATFAKQRGMPFKVVRIETCMDAQNNVHPYGTFCMMLNGRVLTYRPISIEEILAASNPS
jgi:GNAT superfamily N-acetyltransferase